MMTHKDSVATNWCNIETCRKIPTIVAYIKDLSPRQNGLDSSANIYFEKDCTKTAQKQHSSFQCEAVGTLTGFSLFLFLVKLYM